jgi:hypothetical protein
LYGPVFFAEAYCHWYGISRIVGATAVAQLKEEFAGQLHFKQDVV